MNYLELCQRTARECSIPGEGPASVTGQSGILQLIVNWVNQAYEDVQKFKDNWSFRQGDLSFQTISGVDTYAAEMSNISKIRDNSMSAYLTSIGVQNENYLEFLHWNHFYEFYKKQFQSDAQPLHYSISPDFALVLGPQPNDIYTINGQYTKRIDSLTSNSDIPIIPADFHMAIVWKACMYFAGYEEAQVQLELFNRYYSEELGRLSREQAPTITFERTALA